MCRSVFLSDPGDRHTVSKCLDSSLTKLSLTNISTFIDAHLKNLLKEFHDIYDPDLSGCLFDFNFSSVDRKSYSTFFNFISHSNGLEMNSNFKQTCGGTFRLNSTSVNEVP